MTTTNGAPAVTHRVGERGEVSVRIHSGRLEITGTDGDTAVVRDLDGRDLEDRFDVERSEGRLVVRPRERVGFDLGLGRRSRGSARLAIEVPRSATVSFDTASGELEVVGLRGEQHYRTASGEIHATAVSGQIGIDAVSGGVRLVASGPVDLSGRLVSGDLVVRGGSLRSVAVATTSGDIELDSPVEGSGPFSIQTVSGDARVASTGNLRVEARTLTGEIGSELEHRSESGLGRRDLVHGSGARTLAFRSISGNLRVAAHATNGNGGGRDDAPPVIPPQPAVAHEPVAMPEPPAPPSPMSPGAHAADSAGPATPTPHDARLAVLRDLEAGAIDVETATRRLAELEEAPHA